MRGQRVREVEALAAGAVGAMLAATALGPALTPDTARRSPKRLGFCTALLHLRAYSCVRLPWCHAKEKRSLHQSGGLQVCQALDRDGSLQSDRMLAIKAFAWQIGIIATCSVGAGREAHSPRGGGAAGGSG